MRIQPTFWQQLKSTMSEAICGNDGVMNRAGQIMDLAIGSSLSEQHEVASELFGFLGRLPHAVDLAFQLGRWRIRPTAFGEMSLGIQVAPTVADALRAVGRFYRHEVPLIDFSFMETAREGRLTVGFRRPISSQGEALLTAFCVCMADVKIQRITGRSHNIKRLELTPASKAYESGYRKHFFITPETDHQSNVIVLERAVLDFENPHADPHTYDNILSVYAAREELQSNGMRAELRVREWVMSTIGAPPAFDDVAALMRLTPRQLRLVLARQSTSYQAIVRSCRVEYATALFKDPTISLSEIAHRLGYSDLSAFTHAFNRWTGRSPSTFRRELESHPAASSRADG